MTDEARKILAFFLAGLVMIWWMWSDAQNQAKRQAEVASNQTELSEEAIEQSNDKLNSQGTPTLTIQKQPVTELSAEELKAQEFTLENKDMIAHFSNIGGRLEAVELKDFARSKDSEARVLIRTNNGRAGLLSWRFNDGEKTIDDNRASKINRQSSNEVEFVFERARDGLKLTKRYQLADEGFTIRHEVELENVGSETMLIDAFAESIIEAGGEHHGRFNHTDPLEVIGYVNDKRVVEPVTATKTERSEGSSIPWMGVMDRYFLAAYITDFGKAQSYITEPYVGDLVKALDENGNVVATAELIRYGYNSCKGYKSFLNSECRAKVPVYQMFLDQELRSNSTIANLAFYRRGEDNSRVVFPTTQVQVVGSRLMSTDETWFSKLEENGIGVSGTRSSLSFPRRSVSSGETTELSGTLYVGPKSLPILETVGKSVERSIDLSDWFGFIARPMLRFMNWCYQGIGNFGVVIILLTVLVRGLMFPLTHIQFKSMKRMQALKPDLDKLKEKYKDNKEELNRQMFQLMRRHRANPMGGCFPILIQFPVFIALYRVLQASIELRHAPFLGWIQDLSAQDPFFVTPVLVGIVMFMQQKMMPTTAMDPSQEAIQNAMKIMPIMFAGFMMVLPSGLVIYIFVSTLLGVLQQWFMHRPQRNEDKAAA